MELNLRFSQSSVLDVVGRVMIDDQGDIYRGIRPLFAEQIRQIVGLAEANDWFSHGLIPTSVTNHQVDGFPLVLKHMRVPFVTLRGEWSGRALQRAALCYLDLSIELLRAGYCLKDAHAYNVLFSGTRPYMVDFGSIRPLNELNEPHWFREFNFSFRLPLMLFADGMADFARLVLREYMDGVGMFLHFNDPARLLNRPISVPSYDAASLEELRQWVSDLSLSKRSRNGPDDEERPADAQIQAVVDALAFESAIDLRAGLGSRSFICASRGARVLACEGREGQLNTLFDRADASSADVMPVYLSPTRPIGASGVFGTVRPLQDRLRCDLVLALSLLHRLSFEQRYYPDAVIDAIAEYANKSALVEFVPPEDEMLAEKTLPPLDGYSLEEVEASLRRHFEQVEHVSIEPAPRRLFICQGKRH